MLDFDEEYNDLIMPEYFEGVVDPEELEEDVYEDIYYNDKYDYGDYI